MNEVEFEIMKKYRFGGVLDEKDRSLVEELENIGLMKTGYCERPVDKNEHPDAEIIIRTTASLTDTGAGLHYWERVRRNPLRRWWCNFIHSV